MHASSPRPSEISSRIPVSRFREVIPVPKKKEEICDPRFNEAAGKFNKDLFEKSFAFVEDMKKDEKKLIEKETRRTRDPERKGRLQRLLQQMVSITFKREEAVPAEKAGTRYYRYSSPWNVHVLCTCIMHSFTCVYMFMYVFRSLGRWLLPRETGCRP